MSWPWEGLDRALKVSSSSVEMASRQESGKGRVLVLGFWCQEKRDEAEAKFKDIAEAGFGPKAGFWTPQQYLNIH